MTNVNETLPPALLEAIAFAARAHRHQTRKDDRTPYVSHVFRVCLTARHLFGVSDPKVLMAAVLHDTIEDTPTDRDDLEEAFGPEVAEWVAQLTKDMRLPDDAREADYVRVLSIAPWPVRVCKLADLHDNLSDSAHLSPSARARTLTRSKRYLDALATNLPAEAAAAFRIVSELHARMMGVTSSS